MTGISALEQIPEAQTGVVAGPGVPAVAGPGARAGPVALAAGQDPGQEVEAGDGVLRKC